MNRIVERYIYDVTRRLSEKERGEVGKELKACITDMLPDNPKEQDVIDVLTKLGAPGLLAEQYRQNPRYLISPAVFELYISVLKTATMIAAGIFACIGALTVTSPAAIDGIISSVIDSAISGALQAAFWVTFGFAVSEGIKPEPKPWTVNDLPQLTEQSEIKISRSSSIAGIILSAFFTAWLVIMIVRNEWLFIFMRNSEVIVPFSQAALERSVPYVLLLGGSNLLINSLKLFWARWNIPLCLANILNNIVWVGAAIYILRWRDLFSDEFIAFITISSKDYQHILPGGLTTFFSTVFVITAIVDIGESVWKTRKGWIAHEKGQ